MSLRSNAPAFVPQSQSYGDVVTVAPLWLLEDSDDEEDHFEDQLVGKISKDVDSDSGVASTDDCGTTTCEDSDSDEEAMSRQNSSSAASVASPRSVCSSTPSPFDELQAELRRAREHAHAALAESKQLAAEAQLVKELRQAREHAAELAQNLQANGLSALESAANHATQKQLQPQPEVTASMLCLSMLESEESTEAESCHSVEALPSKGSALHFAGNCKSCSFFPMGRCEKGVDCPFCHLPHNRRMERKVRKKERIAAAKSAAEVDESVPQVLPTTNDTERALVLDMAVRSELLKRLGTPPGLELATPPLLQRLETPPGLELATPPGLPKSRASLTYAQAVSMKVL
jgi:small-conductance mechanosensitive channel